MQTLTPAGQNIVNELAQRYNLSPEAVVHMLVSVNNGGGSMAQFNCPELGGSGQWMRNGMIMVGDMFNHGLKATVDTLCNELSDALTNTQMFSVAQKGTSGSNQWWPQDLGSPFSSGAQNNIRYAIFPNRLAVERNGEATIYDTLDHQIGGISQQQGGNTSLTFSSQHGTVDVSSLPIVAGKGLPPEPQTNFASSAKVEDAAASSSTEPAAVEQTAQPANGSTMGAANTTQSKSDEILLLIEKLARLREDGVLTEDEYISKKSELLTRL